MKGKNGKGMDDDIKSEHHPQTDLNSGLKDKMCKKKKTKPRNGLSVQKIVP